MPPPAYMRSGSEASFPSASDSREVSMTVTGLREKKLYALIGCLAILTILAIFLLIVSLAWISVIKKYLKLCFILDEYNVNCFTSNEPAWNEISAIS